MDFLRNILSRNSLRPVWWTTNETVGDFGGDAGVRKAVKDADHNVKVAYNILRNTNVADDVRRDAAYDAIAQAEYNRQILDTVRYY
jgi:hypothetical protein